MRKFIEPTVEIISIEVEDVILASSDATLKSTVNEKSATNIGQVNGVDVFKQGW